MNHSRKRPIVYALRDFPLGCGTQSNAAPFNLPQRSIKIPSNDHDLVPAPRPYGTCLKQETGFKLSHPHLVAAPKPQGTCLKQEPGFKTSDSHLVAAPKPQGTRLKQEPGFKTSHPHLVAAPKPQGTCLKQEPEFKTSDSHLVAAPKPQGTRLKQEPGFKTSHSHLVAAPKPQGTLLKQEPGFKTSHTHLVAAPKPQGPRLKQEPVFKISVQHDPREKVLEVVRLFKEVFRQLDREKQARRGGDLSEATARIDIKTLAVLEKMGKQVNTDKRIGMVPGIDVGDVFQYKTELRVVGLHSKTMCGIDYMKMGDLKLATSIVASEGYGYTDKFDADVVVYTGEGGNVVSKEKKTEDQKLTKGNLALANSMRKKSVVRVIRGEERLDKKGKRYVYDGLYLVDKYWLEKEARGTTVYKFKLCRIPGQPPLT